MTPYSHDIDPGFQRSNPSKFAKFERTSNTNRHGRKTDRNAVATKKYEDLSIWEYHKGVCKEVKGVE